MTRAEFGKTIKLAAFDLAKGRCRNCGNKLVAGNIHFHHDKECAFGGSAELENCIPLCKNCHGKITGARAAVIAKSNRVRAKHIGLWQPPRPSFPTNRNGQFKKKMNGTVERR